MSCRSYRSDLSIPPLAERKYTMANNKPLEFYPADWSADTRILSLAARGAWLELIAAMHVSGRTSSVTGSMERLSGLIGCSVQELKDVLAELEKQDIAEVSRECNGDVTITCRRFRREQIEREQTRERVKKYRSENSVTEMSRECNGDVTAMSRECNGDVTKRVKTPDSPPLKEAPQHPQESTPQEKLSERELKENPRTPPGTAALSPASLKTPLAAAALSPASLNLNHPENLREVIAEAEKHCVRISESQAQDFIDANSVTAQGATWMFRNTPVRDWRKLMNSRWITNWKRDNARETADAPDSGEVDPDEAIRRMQGR